MATDRKLTSDKLPAPRRRTSAAKLPAVRTVQPVIEPAQALATVNRGYPKRFVLWRHGIEDVSRYFIAVVCVGVALTIVSAFVIGWAALFWLLYTAIVLIGDRKYNQNLLDQDIAAGLPLGTSAERTSRFGALLLIWYMTVIGVIGISWTTHATMHPGPSLFPQRPISGEIARAIHPEQIDR